MSRCDRDEPLPRLASASRPWRIAFLLYAGALTLGTHWPRLRLNVGDMPAPDKVLHLLGFAGLAFFLWRTRWIGSVGAFSVICVGWILLDEFTQAIPILGRSFTWLDVAGGALGIALVLIWLWALQPVGGPVSQQRHAAVAAGFDALFAHVHTWLIVGAAGLLAAGLFGMPAAMYVHTFSPQAALSAFFAFGAPGAAGVTAVLVAWLLRRKLRGRWPELPSAVWLRAGRTALMAGLAGACLLIALYVLAHRLNLHHAWLISIWQPAETPATHIPADLRLAVDLTLLGVFAAVLVRICRETIARAVDTLPSNVRPL